MDHGLQSCKMKIAIDLHNLSTVSTEVIRTGIQQVVFNLLKSTYHLRNTFENIEIIPIPYLPYYRQGSLRTTQVNNSNSVLEQTAEEIGVDIHQLWGRDPRNWDDEKFYEVLKDVDYYIITGLCEFRHVALQLPQLKIAALLHDLGPIRRPELVESGMIEWFQNSYLPGITRYTEVIFGNSLFTTLDISHYLQFRKKTPALISTPLPDEEIDEESFKKDPQALYPFPYFLTIGTIEPRKNLELVLQGFKIFKHKFKKNNFKLIMAGKQGWSKEPERIQKIGSELGDDLIHLGYLSRDDLENHLKKSSGLMMPSRFEGYGMPLSLARRFKVPTMTCAHTSLIEASHTNSYYVDPNDPYEVALVMQKIASQKGIDQKQIPSFQSKSWDEFLSHWIQYLSSHSPKEPQSQNISPPKNQIQLISKPRIIFDVHNLSIHPHKLVKTGIQEVAYSILKSVGNLREQYREVCELYATPYLPQDVGTPRGYCPTGPCSEILLDQISETLGKDIWGFPRNQKDYFTDASWYWISGQYDIQRGIASLEDSSPYIKIGHIFHDGIPYLLPLRVVSGLEHWFTEEYLEGIKNYSSCVMGVSRSAALDILHYCPQPSFDLYGHPEPTYQPHLPILEVTSKEAYFVVIGSTDPRKNTVRILKAFQLFLKRYDSNYKIMLVGPKLWRTGPLSSMMKELKGHLIECGYVSDEELHHLIQKSSGVLMPSLYEGFGIPIALARTYGVPVLTSHNTSLTEVCDFKSTVIIDPLSVEDISLGLYKLIQIQKTEPVKTSNWDSYVQDFIEYSLNNL